MSSAAGNYGLKFGVRGKNLRKTVDELKENNRAASSQETLINTLQPNWFDYALRTRRYGPQVLALFSVGLHLSR